MLPDRYLRFLTDISALVPKGRIFTDPLRTLAYGTDASFYRLIPKIVVRADTEVEIAGLLKAADRNDVPVTFRAAGTSLSGQAVSDSVLIVAGSSWNRYEIIDNGGTHPAAARRDRRPRQPPSSPPTAARSAPTRPRSTRP